MKVCIAVMLSRQEPSNRNKKAIYDYIVKDCNELMANGKLKNDYFFIFYKGAVEGTQGLSNRCSISKNDYDFDIQDKNVLPKNCVEIETPTRDGINYTFEKTIECFKMLENLAEEKDYFDYDWLVRINISTFINIRLLDFILDTANKDTIYSTAVNAILDGTTYLNDIYPRGDFYIISHDMVQSVLNVSDKFYVDVRNNDDYEKLFITVPHVDDVLLGICIKQVLGKKYYEHIKPLYYAYIPEYVKENDDISKELFRHILSVRLKTVPPNMHSGYSWDDNLYRKADVIKFKKCQEFYSKQIPYAESEGITINALITPDDGGRPIPVTQHVNTTFKHIKEYLKIKEEN